MQRLVLFLLAFLLVGCVAPTPIIIVVTATPAVTPFLYPTPTNYSSFAPQSIATETPSPTDTPRPSPTRIPPTDPPRPTATRIPPTPAPPDCPQGCTSQKPGCDIKGNISIGSGDKIFHVPGQKYYESTVISPNFGERWFCTEAEARANGWRKSSQ